MKRFAPLIIILMAALSLYSLAIGLLAFVKPGIFYREFAAYTGAFNQHFIRDVGAAFLTAGIALLLATLIAAWRVPLALAGATFLLLHGLIHLQELLAGTTPAEHVVGEVFEILLPAGLVAIAAGLLLRKFLAAKP